MTHIYAKIYAKTRSLYFPIKITIDNRPCVSALHYQPSAAVLSMFFAPLPVRSVSML
jgi:hypothetical protein